MSLEIRGITKRFGAVTAVDSADLSLVEGELLALVGPSGCGKTTLLRMVAGLEAPDAGHVVIAGRDVTHVPPERRRVSIVFQNYALFPHMNVRQNVAYGLKQMKLPSREREERVTELLDVVDLSDLGERRPDQLSAGQQQRVALARALAPRPNVLLLDEPLSALDAALRERLRLEIRRIQKAYGITTLLVTHDQEEALATADRIAVMNAGLIEQVGDPWHLYDRPATAFVARFIGKGHSMEALVGVERADIGPLGSVPRAYLPAELVPGKALLLIRPEAISLEDAVADDPVRQRSGLSLHVILTDVTFNGATCSLHLRHEDLRLLATVAGARYSELRDRLGAQLHVTIPYQSLRWVPFSSHERQEAQISGENTGI